MAVWEAGGNAAETNTQIRAEALGLGRAELEFSGARESKLTLAGLLAERWTSKAMLMTDQSENRAPGETVSIFLRERGRMLVEMGTCKGTLVRSQVERRSMFLELVEKTHSLNCVLAFYRR